MLSTAEKDAQRLAYLQKCPDFEMSALQLNSDLPNLPNDGYASLLRLEAAGQVVRGFVANLRVRGDGGHVWNVKIPYFKVPSGSK